MSSMEAMLMGDSSSDSDGEDGSSKAGTQVTASTGASPKPPVVAAAAPPPPPPGSGSKSDLTNRLKNLYGTSPPKGGPPKVGAPLPRPGGPPVAHRTGGPAPLPPGRNVAPPPNSGARPGQMPPGHPPNYVPPMVHAAQHRGPQQGKPGQPSQPQQMPQQRGAPPPRPGMPLPQPPPTVQGTVGRVPAPLPKARTTHRSAPPSNRPVASVPMQGRGGAPPPSPLTSTAQQGQSRQYQQARGPQPQQAPPQPQQMQQQQRQQQQQQMQQRQQQQQQQMQQRQQQQQQMQRRQPVQPPPQQMPPQQQQQQRPPSGNVTPDARSAASGGGVGSSANLTEAEKKEKERFLMFTRVLMKYLEQRDNVMHAKAKAQIKECYERNKQGDPEFRSLTSSMKARLRSTVGELYWKKAHDYLDHFLKQKKGKGGQGQSRSSQQAQVQRQQPGQPPQQQAPSSTHGAPPPIVRTAQPPQQPQQQQQHLMTQSQAAAAKKVPIASSSRPVQQPSTVPVAAPPATATAVPAAKPPTTAAAKGKKGETDEERKKREKRNEQNRKKRAKRKMEKEAKEAAEKAKAEKAGVKIAGLPTGVGIQHPVVQTSTLGVTASAASMTSSTASVTSTASSKAKEKKAVEAAKKKKKKPLTKAPSIIKRQNSLKQPNRLMDNVDHAVMIDVKTIPNLLSKEHKIDVNLDEEQRILLYGDEKRQAKVKEVTKAAAAALGAGSDARAGDTQAEMAKLADVGVPPLPWKLPAAYTGWGNKNVLDVRTAWAKVRLPEGEKILAERAQEEKERAQREKPMVLSSDNVSGGVEGQTPILAERALSSGSIISKPVDRSGPSAPTIKEDTTNHVWYNETRAEQDPTLAMLSEATETFLKSAIENAIGKARLRQNLDGVRLWHTLHAHSVAKSTVANGSKDVDNDDKPPPALIRLGCDVRRQIALAEGNAAKTYQRMEEAISRQNDTYRSTESSQDPDAMLLESTSMADLSRKPPLKSAAQTADLDAKRKYAVFGGSESQEPPLGRVPKKARVTLQDIVVGEVGNRTSMIGARRKRFRVGLRY